MRRSSNAALFWPVMLLVTASDYVRKALAVKSLVPKAMPHNVLRVWFVLALVLDLGAAFGLYLGLYLRFILMGLTIVALIILARLYRSTRPGDASRVIALALV